MEIHYDEDEKKVFERGILGTIKELVNNDIISISIIRDANMGINVNMVLNKDRKT